ncbi:Interleukin-13 Receptor Subunit Alpha-1 [Manis pentadactyla]|nr:Interleukin-13 Receptor Subunit Alpha-1 [Manis pentadactyla]
MGRNSERGQKDKGNKAEEELEVKTAKLKHIVDTVQALYYWHRALTAARRATHGGGSTLASVRRARVYPGKQSVF